MPARPSCARCARDMQIIFQDPYASLNPRMTVGAIIGEALIIHKLATDRARVRGARRRAARDGRPAAPTTCGATRTSSPAASASASASRARSRSSPKLIVCDEPVSALDVSIQAQVINLLEDLQEQVRPDLPLHRARPVGGRAHQHARRGDVSRPHRRDRAGARTLRRSRCIPTPRRCSRRCRSPTRQVKRKRILLQGDVPSPIRPPTGCHFHTRCPIAQFPLCSSDGPS